MKGDNLAGFRIAESIMPLMVQLAQRYYPVYLQRMGGDDFRQEILLFIVERLPLYDKAKSAITTWAGWQLRHFASDKFRKAGDLVRVPACALYRGDVTAKAYSDYDFSDMASRDLEPWEYAIANEAESVASDLVDLLIRVAPTHAKETIRLRHKVGLNLEQIAQHFGVTRQAIDLRCQAAYRSLNQHYRMKGKANVVGRNAQKVRV